ncbi:MULTISPECIES: ATPase, T2SS/T4P/T4SS family [Vibrio]|uniref:GspE/PulE family protein n=2 Tax=Vibrionaceae TaxID=641 RepID=UPI000841983E|nr:MULTISPECIES: ATPase, T2SS/T4P/T4SS family [Vibrio]ODM56866.1 hypothetical protein BC455_18575 [Vibrio harveyi]USD58493.1 Flp pilus assembly complex ATPase component TadA [Vibrio sp. SCSIO 43155]
MGHVKPEIIERLQEVGVVVFTNKGEIKTSDLHSPHLKELSAIFQSDSELFNGVFYGEEPKIVHVTQEEVQRELSLLVQNNSSKLTRKKDETKVGDDLRSLLTTALDKKASDIHVIVTDTETIFKGRIDGALTQLIPNKSREYGENILSYAFMRMGQTTGYSLKSDLDATFSLPLTKNDDVQHDYDWRISQLNTVDGSKATIRNLDSPDASNTPSLDDLGLTEGHKKYVEETLMANQGAFFLSGPTGSGKTTTICSAILWAATDESRLFHTLEDPVEWNLAPENVIQTSVNPTARISEDVAGFKDFAYFGKKLLRNDTDVVFIGEIRDHQVAKTALRMANTGQIAIATLHCNSALDIVGELMQQMDINPALLGSKGVISALAHQRLVRKICPTCHLSYKYVEDHYSDLEDSLQEAFTKVNTLIENEINNGRRFKNDEPSKMIERVKRVKSNIKFKNSKGCQHCIKGEKGRTALFEMVLLDDYARDCIKKSDLAAWERDLKERNWPSIKDHGVQKIFSGIADIRSVERELSNLNKKPIDEMFDEMWGEF